MMQRRGFTLLEVLVSGAVLFVVSSAVVGLSNSLVQGTTRTTDETTTRNLTSEGLELVTKIRDDNYKNPTLTNGSDPIWFPAVDSADNYGWYVLKSQTDANNVTTWSLQPTSFRTSNLTLNSPSDLQPLISEGEKLTANNDTFYRLICIESVGANSQPKDTSATQVLHCNKDKNDAFLNDGDRNNIDPTTCQSADAYCNNVIDSLNATSLLKTTAVTPGNAVKVRSVVVWQSKDKLQFSDSATLLTNSRSLVK